MNIFIICVALLLADKEAEQISAGDYILLELKTGGTIRGTLVNYDLHEKNYSITILLQQEKLYGYMVLDSGMINNIIRLKKNKLDLGTIKRKRQQFISKSEQIYKKKLSEMEERLRQEEKIRTQKRESEKKVQVDSSKISGELTDELKELLARFPAEQGYGEEKYNEYKRYWIKTNKTPPYIDLRTNAPPPDKEIEFYDNYSLWSYARSLTEKQNTQIED